MPPSIFGVVPCAARCLGHGLFWLDSPTFAWCQRGAAMSLWWMSSWHGLGYKPCLLVSKCILGRFVFKQDWRHAGSSPGFEAVKTWNCLLLSDVYRGLPCFLHDVVETLQQTSPCRGLQWLLDAFWGWLVWERKGTHGRAVAGNQGILSFQGTDDI